MKRLTTAAVVVAVLEPPALSLKFRLTVLAAGTLPVTATAWVEASASM